MASTEPSNDATRDQNPISIEFPPDKSADDEQVVSDLVALVNRVYGASENDIFTPEYRRTSTAEMKDLLRSRKMAVAYLDQHEPMSTHSSSDQSGSGSARKIIGCLYIKLLSPTLGDFGMLALDQSYRGGGLGRRLVQFAEETCRARGCTEMQLELLFPSVEEHAGKKRLQEWYLRMGYEIVKLGNFNEEYPHLAPLLAGPADYKIFVKKLT